MSWIPFIANKKSVFNKTGFASVISKVAVIGVAISVTVMLLSLSVLKGYKTLIKDKMAGFSGHIQVLSVETSQFYEYVPFIISDNQLHKISKLKGVSSVFPVIQKAGIAKTDFDLEGIVLKGLLTNNDSIFYKSILKYGKMPIVDSNGRSNQIVISAKLAQTLQCDTGQKIRIYFFGNKQVRAMAPVVCGIYSTGVEEYDKLFALCSYQDLVSYAVPIDTYKEAIASNNNAVTHLEVKVKNFDQLETISEDINQSLPQELRCETIKSLQSQVFDWLGYLDKNIEIILILMGLVAAINMTTAILILIVDSTALIGLLKSVGATSKKIEMLFIRLAMQIIFFGLLIGNVFAITFITLQYYFKIIKLNEENYYTSFVPVVFNWTDFIWINLATIIICSLFMYLPSKYISGLSAIKAIRFK